MQGVAAIFWSISLVLTILTMPVLLWQAAIGVFGLLPDRRKIPAAKRTEKPHRFAVVVCARNEQAVIGKLLDSLYAQDYPRDLFTLYVAADNCTDGTTPSALARTWPKGAATPPIPAIPGSAEATRFIGGV